jgi:hypothetical protein
MPLSPKRAPFEYHIKPTNSHVSNNCLSLLENENAVPWEGAFKSPF